MTAPIIDWIELKNSKGILCYVRPSKVSWFEGHGPSISAIYLDGLIAPLYVQINYGDLAKLLVGIK